MRRTSHIFTLFKAIFAFVVPWIHSCAAALGVLYGAVTQWVSSGGPNDPKAPATNYPSPRPPNLERRLPYSVDLTVRAPCAPPGAG